jgi:hypothetical protein
MRDGHGAHEQDHRHHHEAGCRHARAPADLPSAGRIHDGAPCADEHEQEGAEELAEQPARLQADVVEVV